MSADVAETVWYTEDSAQPLTVSKPAGFGSGQIMVFVLSQDSGALSDLTTPSGWTALSANVDITSQRVKAWSYKFTGSDPASWDFGYNSGASVAGGLFRITGADTTPTIVSATGSSASNGSTMDSPSVVPTGTDDLLIVTYSNQGGGTALVETDPSGTTDLGQGQVTGNFQCMAGAKQQLSSGSATGVRTWTGLTPTGGAAGTFSIAVKSTSSASSATAPTLLVPQAQRPNPSPVTVSPPTLLGPQAIPLAPFITNRPPQPPAEPPITAVNPPFGPPAVIRPAPIVVVKQAPPPLPAIILTGIPALAAAILRPAATVVAFSPRPTVVGPIAITPPFGPPQAIPPAPIVVAPQARATQPATVIVVVAQIPAPVAGILSTAGTTVAFPPRVPAVPPIVLTPPGLPQPPAPIAVVAARTQGQLATVITLLPAPLPQALAPTIVITSSWRPAAPQIITPGPSLLPPFPGVTLVVPSRSQPTLPAPIVVVSQFGPVAQPILALPQTIVIPAWPIRSRPFVFVAFGAPEDCEVIRPNTGTVTRTTSTVTRPNTGTVAYALATVSRPNTGIVDRPRCD